MCIHRGYGGRPVPELSKREEEELINDWEPEPLGTYEK